MNEEGWNQQYLKNVNSRFFFVRKDYSEYRGQMLFLYILLDFGVICCLGFKFGFLCDSMISYILGLGKFVDIFINNFYIYRKLEYVQIII